MYENPNSVPFQKSEETYNSESSRPTVTSEKLLVRDSEGHVKNTITIEETAPHPDKQIEGAVPIIIAPGFAEGLKTLRENIIDLGGRGRNTITYDAPQGIDTKATTLTNINTDDFRQYEIGKAAALLKVLEHKHLERVDAVGHSEGCIYLVLAAMEKPECFRSLILVNPGGMVGEDSFLSLIKRAYTHMRLEHDAKIKDPAIHSAVTHAKKERLGNLFQNIVHGAQSPRAIACTHIEELLATLKHEKGINIIIVHSVDDVVFPMDRVQKMSKAHFLDGFYAVRGGHNDFFLKPEDHGLVINEALTALEARDKKISQEGTDIRKTG
jgi:pimeloyl-ACP methyl ester carboxylesterase